jgi:RNA polymerase sigma factor (sigma-70 family)
MKIIKTGKMRPGDKSGCPAKSTDWTSLSDEQLWQYFTAGNKQAFEQIYYQYVNTLYDYGVRLGNDTRLSEDCVQDLFSYLWVNRRKLPVVKAVRAYLFAAFKRRVYRKLNEQKKDIAKIYITLEPQAYSFYPNLEDQAENIEALKEAFGVLSERQREAIYLRFYNQLSYEEIAEVMEVQVKAVYKLMARAIQKLKKTMTHSIVAQFLLVILATQ